jgi:hypothetical protein
MENKRFSLNKQDIQKAVKNAAIFLAPALLVFLMTLESGGSLDEALIAIRIWGLNTLIDLIRKYIAK